MDYYINFLGKQLPEPVDSEWFTPEQRALLQLTRNFNALLSDLEIKFTNTDSTGPDAYVLESRIIELENYIDYLARAIDKILNMQELQMYGHYTTPIYENGSVVEKTTNAPNYGDDTLLRIDTSGNIWINGQIETSAIKIGNKIKELAEKYNENKPINSLNEFSQ